MNTIPCTLREVAQSRMPKEDERVWVCKGDDELGSVVVRAIVIGDDELDWVMMNWTWVCKGDDESVMRLFDGRAVD